MPSQDRIDAGRWGDDYHTLKRNAEEVGKRITARDGVEAFIPWINERNRAMRGKHSTGLTLYKNLLKINIAIWYKLNPSVAMKLELHHLIPFSRRIEICGPDEWWNMALISKSSHEVETEIERRYGRTFSVEDSWYIRQCSLLDYHYGPNEWWDAFNGLRRLYPIPMGRDVNLFKIKTQKSCQVAAD